MFISFIYASLHGLVKQKACQQGSRDPFGPGHSVRFAKVGLASAGLIRFAHAPAARANGFLLAPTKFRGRGIGIVRWYCAGRGGIGLAACKLAHLEPTTPTASPRRIGRRSSRHTALPAASGVPV